MNAVRKSRFARNPGLTAEDGNPYRPAGSSAITEIVSDLLPSCAPTREPGSIPILLSRSSFVLFPISIPEWTASVPEKRLP
jgi:hypothetical protein